MLNIKLGEAQAFMPNYSYSIHLVTETGCLFSLITDDDSF